MWIKALEKNQELNNEVCENQVELNLNNSNKDSSINRVVDFL